jgi:hypothetical protein
MIGTVRTAENVKTSEFRYMEKNKILLIIEGLYFALKLLGIISVGFDVTDQQLIMYFAFVKYSRKNGNTIGLFISYL